jgi:cytochrome c biogenesis protein CcmG/thiol:disulfide interchange protein DsbE
MPSPRTRKFPVFPAVTALVVVLGVIAVVASRGSGSKDSGKVPGVEETRPVVVRGTALVDYDSGQSNDPALGATPPVLEGAAFDGTPVHISNDGKGHVVMFVAHWCPHCQKEVPLITQYLASNQPPAGVELFGVSTAVNPNLDNYPPSAWLAREHWPVRTMADDTNSSAGSAYGLTAFPYFVATDPAGKVVARATGEISMNDFAALMQKAAGAPAGA